MRKKRKLLWIVCPLLIALLLASVTIWVIAENAEPPTPSVSIEKFNLSFEDHVFLKYAVKLNEADAAQLGSENFRLLFWTSPHTTYEKGTENSSVSVLGTTKIGGEDYYTFAYTELAAKQMADTVYARAYINVGGNVYYSDVEKYSIVQYAYDVFHSETATQELKTLVTEMLSYGAAAQDYFNYNENRPANGAFLQIEVINGTLEDGFSTGLYLEGEQLELNACEINEEKIPFSHWENSAGENVSNERTAILTASANEETYTAIFAEPHTPLEHFIFNELSDGTYAIKAKNTNNLPKNVVVPSVYNGKAVTKLDQQAFASCRSLESVIIPDSITEVGSYAFYDCINLTSVKLSNSLTKIGYSMFYGCISLKNLSIPDSVSEVLENGIRGCSNLESISFGENSQLSSIGELALEGCCALQSITIPNSVTIIGNSAFNGCDSLRKTTYENALYIGSEENPYLYLYSGISIDIEEVAIHSLTKYLGYEAFKGFEKIKTIKIPSSVINIHPYAFYGCKAITNITFEENSQITSIGAYAFYECENIESIIIPDSIIFIYDSAFAECHNLKSVTIPNIIPSIGSYAFKNCNTFSTVYYIGTADEWRWNNISGDGNSYLENATYYYYSETTPTAEGNYWHYVDGVPTKW